MELHRPSTLSERVLAWQRQRTGRFDRPFDCGIFIPGGPEASRGGVISSALKHLYLRPARPPALQSSPRSLCASPDLTTIGPPIVPATIMRFARSRDDYPWRAGGLAGLSNNPYPLAPLFAVSALVQEQGILALESRPSCPALLLPLPDLARRR